MEAGPSVDPRTGEITFTVSSGESERPLRVWFHLRDFGADPAFRPTATGRWTATIPAPPADRLEYLFAWANADGTETLLPDPGNPLLVPGPFGDKSLLELPTYRPPRWLTLSSQPWVAQPLAVTTGVEGVEVAGELLTPPGSKADKPLPLLVVHDGPEYSRLARLGDYLTWLDSQSPELSCRVLLLQPGNRDLSYAASAPYTEALVERAIPLAQTMAPTRGAVVGLGASLGALALMHAAAMYPGTFGALVCQSGSFFRPRFDAHERRFRYYDRVVEAVDAVYAEPSALAGLEIALTSGLGEENLENNRALADRLAELGVQATLAVGRDGHNYTAWRDLLDPTLGSLLAHVWRA